MLVKDLKTDGCNPNAMSDKQHERLKTSIQKYGFIVPIITNKDLLIADGEQRLTVAQSLQMRQVPVIRLPVEDVDRRLLRQVLNKLRGEHELLADAQEFSKIIEMGGEDDLKHLLDLSDSSLEKYLREIRETKDEDYEVPEIDKVETDIKRGDIYKLGEHRLMCGDATSREDVEALMDGNKADMVFTDPPYGVDYDGGTTKRDKLEGDTTTAIYDSFLSLLSHYIKHTAPVYLWHSDLHAREVLTATNKYGFEPRALIVWNKNLAQFGCLSAQYKQKHEPCLYMGLKGKKINWYGPTNEVTVWDINRAPKNEYHPTQKPVELAERAILNSSHNPNIILDLFGGSGSTLIACEQTGRACYMMEIDPRYCQVIIDRWQKYTGQEAVKISDFDV